MMGFLLSREAQKILMTEADSRSLSMTAVIETLLRDLAERNGQGGRRAGPDSKTRRRNRDR